MEPYIRFAAGLLQGIHELMDSDGFGGICVRVFLQP
jgi:hypothetical protein